MAQLSVITVEFEITLTHIGPLPSKLARGEIQMKWKKGNGPKDSGSSSKFALPDPIPSIGLLLSLPVSFQTRLTRSDIFEAKIIHCSIKYVRISQSRNLESLAQFWSRN